MSSATRCWVWMGSVRSEKAGAVGSDSIRQVLRQRVASSASKVSRLCRAKPSSVRRRAFFSRAEHQFGAKMVGHGPPDHLAAEYIKHDGQIHEPGPSRHVGDVGDPDPARRIGPELTLHPVWSRTVVRPLARGAVLRRRLTAANPDSRISRATRFRPTRQPPSSSSACTRTIPYVPSESSWMRRFITLNSSSRRARREGPRPHHA